MASKINLTGYYTVRVEVWRVKGGKIVPKIAVRDKGGRFHGATNFRQKV